MRRGDGARAGDVERGEQDAHMDSKLPENRHSHVGADDGGGRAAGREGCERLGVGHEEEEHCRHHSRQHHLLVAELDAVEVERGEAVRERQAGQRLDLVDFHRSDERAAALERARR